MGRPLNHKYFGNTNTGSATTRNDNFIGGEGVASVVVTNTTTNGTYASTATIAFSAPQIVGGVAATGTPTIVGSRITAITITDSGSGYTSAPTFTVTPATGGTVVTYTVALTTSQQNAFTFSSWVPLNNSGVANGAGSAITGGDIIKQSGKERFLVRNSQGSGVCKLATTSTLTIGQMSIIATDANGSTYYCTRLTNRRVTLTRAVVNGSFVYATGDRAAWSLSAASGTDKTAVGTRVQLANA